MASYFGARGAGSLPKKLQADAAAIRIALPRFRVAAMSDDQKTTLLARAIAKAAASRGEVDIRDGMQAGLTEKETRVLFDAALALARRIDPAILGNAP